MLNYWESADLANEYRQGKHFAVPERVPFRLTNNIVDGMGVAGVEGRLKLQLFNFLLTLGW